MEGPRPVRRLVAGVVSAVLLAIAAPAASAAVIGFDDQSAGTVLDEQYASLGVHFGPSPFPGDSGKFTAVARPGQSRSAPNVAAFAYDPGTDFSSSWIRFDRQQRKVTLYVCRTGGAGDPSQPNVNVDAFDSNGTQIDNQQGIQCNLNGPLVPVTVEKQNITYIHVAGTGGSAPPGAGWGLDDLEFETAPAPQPPPPPPRRTLTVTTSGSGTGTVTGTGIDCGGAGHSDCSETVPRGTAITLTAASASNSTFGGFAGGGCAGASRCTVTLDADTAVAATFTVIPTDPPGVLSSVCRQLRTLRASIAAQFGRLIAQNPSIAGPATAYRNAVLRTLDAVLAHLGCLPAAKAAQADIPGLQLGTARGDRLRGSAGDDVQAGMGGNDRLTGGHGRDLMLGDAGRDRLDGGPGADIVAGGAGKDALKAGSGADLILGDAGNDTINARGGGRDYVVCGGGRDRVSADKRDVIARDCELVSRR
jgi:hypothetical protein